VTKTGRPRDEEDEGDRPVRWTWLYWIAVIFEDLFVVGLIATALSCTVFVETCY
jgi:hypothetical protein